MLIWYYIFIFWTCASIWCRNNQATLPSWPSSILGSPRPKRWETFFPPWKDLVLRVSIHFLLHNRHEIALVGHHGSFGWGVAMLHNVSPRRHHQNHVTRSEDESGFYSTQCCWSQNWHFHGFPLNFHWFPWISMDFHWISTDFQAFHFEISTVAVPHLLHAGQQRLGVHPRLHSQVGNEARTEVTWNAGTAGTWSLGGLGCLGCLGGYDGYEVGHELTHWMFIRS